MAVLITNSRGKATAFSKFDIHKSENVFLWVASQVSQIYYISIRLGKSGFELNVVHRWGALFGGLFQDHHVGATILTGNVESGVGYGFGHQAFERFPGFGRGVVGFAEVGQDDMA